MPSDLAHAAAAASVSVRACFTPRPFVERVATALGDIAHERLEQVNLHLGGSDDQVRQGYAVQRLAGYITTVDQRDPRLWALLKVYEVLRVPGDPRWVPGPEQRRVLSGLGHGVSVDVELTELATAGVEDVAAERNQTVTSLAREVAELRAQVERLAPYRLRAAEEDVEHARSAITPNPDPARGQSATPFHQLPQAIQARQRAEAELVAARAAEPTPVQAAAEPEPEPEKLPQGIRRRASGTFQAFFRDASGKQQQQGGFKSVAEAVEYRNARLAEIAARKNRRREVAA